MALNRVIQHPRAGGRLMGFTGTTAATPSATLSKGFGDGTASYVAAGRLGITFLEAFSQPPGGASGYNIAGAIVGTNASGGDKSKIRNAAKGFCEFASGGGSEFTCQGMVFGYDTTDSIDANIPSDVKSTINNPRLIACQIDGVNGDVNIGGGSVSLVKNGTGDYTITFLQAFGQTPQGVGGLTLTATNTISVVSSSASSIRIRGSNSGGTATDTDFNLMVLGSDSIEERGRARKQILTNMRKPRLLAFSHSVAAAVVFGSQDVTGVDNGTGDYTFTYANAFAREPIVVATRQSGSSNRYVRGSGSSSTGITLLTVNGSDVAEDGESLVLVLGSDDPSEY